MKVLGKKVNLGWLLVLASLLVMSFVGLRTDAQEGQFDLSGDHLWANVAWMLSLIHIS